jgi:hypothetical protein
MGISRQGREPGMQNGLGASGQLQHGGPRRKGDGVPAEATRPLGATSTRPAAAVRRRAAAALIAAAAAASVVAVPAGAASARPLPSDSSPGPSCRVDVRAARLLGGVAYHLFIIYREQGRDQYFRGGPSNGGSSGASRSSSNSSSNSGRRIVTDYGPYKPGTVDYDPNAYSVTVLKGAAACGKDRCLAAQARRIEKLHRLYASLGPNSNSVARTLLAKCHLPVDKPHINTPGFDEVL